MATRDGVSFPRLGSAASAMDEIQDMMVQYLSGVSARAVRGSLNGDAERLIVEDLLISIGEVCDSYTRSLPVKVPTNQTTTRENDVGSKQRGSGQFSGEYQRSYGLSNDPRGDRISPYRDQEDPW